MFYPQEAQVPVYRAAEDGADYRAPRRMSRARFGAWRRSVILGLLALLPLAALLAVTVVSSLEPGTPATVLGSGVSRPVVLFAAAFVSIYALGAALLVGGLLIFFLLLDRHAGQRR